MFRKFYFLIFASLALVVHSAPPEPKLDQHTAIRNIVKYYLQMVDELFTTMKKANEPIFKDLANNKFTTNKKLEEKITDLKMALEKTDIPYHQFCLKMRVSYKQNLLSEIGKVCDELDDIEAADTENESIFNTVYAAIEDEAVISMERFTDKSLQDLEKLWNDLSTKEQEEQQELGKLVAGIKSANILYQKMDLVDRVFDFRSDAGKVLSNYVPLSKQIV